MISSLSKAQQSSALSAEPLRLGKEWDETTEIRSATVLPCLWNLLGACVCGCPFLEKKISLLPQLSLRSESSALCAACAQFHAICCRSKETEKQIGEEYHVLESQHPIVPTTASWEHNKTLVGCNCWGWHKMCPNLLFSFLPLL